MSKELIVFYSRSGGNYVDGELRNLPVGNTARVAAELAQLIGAEQFEIEQVNPYSTDYCTCIDQAKQDQTRGTRPAIQGHVPEFSQYGTIYLGYPNYWGTMPMAVFTFLEQHDFTGKQIVPFCTHEGSGFGNSLRDLKKACPTAKILPGFSMRGADVDYELSAIQEWLENSQELKK